MAASIAVGALSLAIWLYLLLARGSFWRIHSSPVPPIREAARARRVAVIIPARNEADVIDKAVASLLRQDYPGNIHVFVCDDHSSDGTGVVAQSCSPADRISIVPVSDLPAGWTGKLWAMSAGLRAAEAFRPDYFLLTDADIVHAPDNVSSLIARLEAGSFDLASYMVKLHCRSRAERALIPAFVFFFFLLYPPAWIARHDRRTAGAAGGCILIRPEALDRMGGIAAIRDELIDDCALAAAVKKQGSIWLGVTSSTRSIREYPRFTDVGDMISRTAFTQLRYSPLLLAGTIIGLAVTYLAPPLLLLSGNTIAATLGLASWMLMMIAFLPAVRFYGQSAAWAATLPGIALFYMSATVRSALRYWTGRGGMWKGRVQAR